MLINYNVIKYNAYFFIPVQRPLVILYPPTEDDACSVILKPNITFDLRAYIEAGGHQIEDWSYHIDESSCQGFLKKLSGAGVKNLHHGGRSKWLKRWFVFDRQSKTLSYFRRRSNEINRKDGTTETKIRPRASISFQVKSM